eukprot:1189802-Prorocentrum_minimum.AAC.4
MEMERLLALCQPAALTKEQIKLLLKHQGEDGLRYYNVLCGSSAAIPPGLVTQIKKDYDLRLTAKREEI